MDVSIVAVEPASEAESLTDPASDARECNPSSLVRGGGIFESDGGAEADGGAMGAFPAARELDELEGSPSDMLSTPVCPPLALSVWLLTTD